ncbi:MAG: ABC transporter permease [Runella slithyformis]|nr:MAG: ABC transporter permease [Runella slithyformis]TAF01275.1 MAG: ABC transporter permease [Runella slithyformis]TAF25715.1 MAG: ABC transporter permease [Runella slithyformis]TAF44163.1 MAG: ABC transporter permease [Runella slithyformis]TAF81424.1 MAG: ABC transporter permease [Runella slithyformis]
MLRNYLKIAFRSLFKNRTYTFINIGGLALGMAVAVLITLWVQNELNYDGYHRQAKDIYRVNTHLKVNETEAWHWAATPLKFADAFKENIPEIKEATRLYVPWNEFSLTVNNEALTEDKMGFIDKNWFQVFDYQFIKGSYKDFIQDKNNIAITESRATKFFGKQNPIGKIIKHDSLNFVVVAILKDLPSNSVFRFEVLAQNGARLANPKELANDLQWSNFNYQTFVVCNNGIDAKAVSAKLTNLLIKLRAEEDSKTTLELEPLTAIHLGTSIKAEGMPLAADKTILSIFGLVAFFILLVACINYVNLSTAKASQRTKEVSVKKIIGATNGSLFNQFFLESIITSLIAAALAIVLIINGLTLLENLVDNRFSLTGNPVVWIILSGTTLFSIVLTGIYPSVLLSSLQPIKLLKGINVGGSKNASFRKGLVVFQFTFTIVLLIGTFLIFKQLQFIQNKKLGYDKSHVFTFAIPWNVKNAKVVRQTMMQQFDTESSIKAVTSANENIVDMRSTHSGSLNWKGKDPKTEPRVGQFCVSANFKDFFDLKLSDGRWFDKANAGDDNNVILNETAIKEFNIPKPVVGQQFEFHGKKGQIIGIAKDFHFRSPKEKIMPLVLYTNSGWQSTVFVKTSPNQLQKSIAIAEKTWKELVPGRAFKYAFLDETYEKLHRAEQNQLQMFAVFAAIVLLISCFGLFGLATFAAEIRTKEIGIRKVLGASVASITALLSKDFLKLVLVAIVIASPVAYYLMNKWLESFAYKTEISVWVFAASGSLAVGVACLTVGYQAIRAALVNPVKSLKTE